MLTSVPWQEHCHQWCVVPIPHKKQWLSPLRRISDRLSQTFPCGPEKGKGVLESLEKVRTSYDSERNGDCWSCSSKSDSAKNRRAQRYRGLFSVLVISVQGLSLKGPEW